MLLVTKKYMEEDRRREKVFFSLKHIFLTDSSRMAYFRITCYKSRVYSNTTAAEHSLNDSF